MPHRSRLLTTLDLCPLPVQRVYNDGRTLPFHAISSFTFIFFHARTTCQTKTADSQKMDSAKRPLWKFGISLLVACKIQQNRQLVWNTKKRSKWGTCRNVPTQQLEHAWINIAHFGLPTLQSRSFYILLDPFVSFFSSIWPLCTNSPFIQQRDLEENKGATSSSPEPVRL